MAMCDLLGCKTLIEGQVASSDGVVVRHPTLYVALGPKQSMGHRSSYTKS